MATKTKVINETIAKYYAENIKRLADLVIEQIEAESPYGETFEALAVHLIQASKVIGAYGSNIGQPQE
jgi:hypothetical protein